MADDVYKSAVVGGGLKLKGSKSSGFKKKKKKKNKAEQIEAQASTSSPSSSRKVYNDEDEDSEEVKPDSRTPAEVAFQKAQERRAAERIMKKASKTHRQRVAELNSYLDNLSEHYDIQKVSWTK